MVALGSGMVEKVETETGECTFGCPDGCTGVCRGECIGRCTDGYTGGSMAGVQYIGRRWNQVHRWLYR